MAKFHKLKVSDVRKETDDCVSIAFDIPSSLKSEYTYVQGQYITFKLDVGGEIRRSYSICSSPVADTELRVAVKKTSDGRGSKWLNENVKNGDELEVMTPMGNFHSPINSAHTKHYILFAGGSGITPMLSIIKTVLAKEPNSKITLLYGNRDEKSTIFKTELENHVGSSANKLNVIHILENPSQGVDELYKGRLDKEKVKALVAKHIILNGDNEFFVCGPTPMMDNVKAVLSDLKVDSKKVHIEYFTASLEAPKQTGNAGEDITSQITVTIDGVETSFELNTNGDSILDGAINAGADAPYACKGAVCCTCKAKIIEGKVKMDMNYALTDDEVEDGYILTCQSHPLTPVVVVDYDHP